MASDTHKSRAPVELTDYDSPNLSQVGPGKEIIIPQEEAKVEETHTEWLARMRSVNVGPALTKLKEARE
jgi:hypothetical protein